MYVHAVTICGFRSFSHETTVQLDRRLTTLIGANGSGKTAFLVALARVFGVGGRGRGLERLDFHIPPGASDSQKPRDLWIEVLFRVPELDNDSDDKSAVPEVFSALCCDEDGKMWCRFRLEGSLSFAGSADGDIEEKVYHISSLVNKLTEKHKHPLPIAARNSIHVYYVPATRDPMKELAYSTRSLVGRIIAAAIWDDTTKEQVFQASKAVASAIEQEQSVKTINEAISIAWKSLHRSELLDRPNLRFLAENLGDILASLSVSFYPGPEGGEVSQSFLSEGQRSLFYLALFRAAQQIERNLATGKYSDLFDLDRVRPASFAMLAMEEPENHLSPHYLGRISNLLSEFSATQNNQVVITSHSAGIVKRVNAGGIRRFRLTSERASIIRAIKLPTDDVQACKFLVSTIHSYPEMLFSRVVILSEGDSERVVLPRLILAYNSMNQVSSILSVQSGQVESGKHLDDSFVSVVPVGGRNAQLFWTMLSSLDIPFVTLLDLDYGRRLGGERRIGDLVKQLLPHLQSKEKASFVKSYTAWKKKGGPREKFEALDWLEAQHVFLSSPLDFDFLMLRHYKSAYSLLTEDETGPRKVPAVAAKKIRYQRALLRAVLKEGCDEDAVYTDYETRLFRWYRYRFLNASKPSSHLRALASLSESKLKKCIPSVVERLISSTKLLASKDPE